MSTLENLVRVGQLKLEPPSDDEIATSLRKAALYLADAALPSLSPPSRFMLAYDAAHSLPLRRYAPTATARTPGAAIGP
ncbi:MAG: hypothetical protein QG672_1917 [Pseudomonadota bacterium]|nr:hypothetical protein [Pseudomonadota bacterium]